MASLVYLTGINVEAVSGLAKGRAAALRNAGINSVADLLLHVPRKYLDRSRIEPIALAPVGEEVTIVGRVTTITSRRPRAKMLIVEVRVTDGTSVIPVVFFNQAFRIKQLPEGTEVALSGKIERFRGKPQMNNPAVDVLDSDLENLTTGRVVPIHSQVGVVSPGVMRRAMHNALRGRGRSRTRFRPKWSSASASPIAIPPSPTSTSRPNPRTAGRPAAGWCSTSSSASELALALQKRRQMAEARGIAHRRRRRIGCPVHQWPSICR